MGKRDTKDTLKDVKSSQANAQSNYEQARNDVQSTLPGLQSNVESGRAGLQSAYGGLTDTNRVTDTTALSDLGTKFADYGSSAGLTAPTNVTFDAGAKSRILGDIGSLREYAGKVGGQGDALAAFGQTGGLDAEAANRFRGLGVYDEYAKSGGYTDTDKANIRARSLSPISSYATGSRDELARRAALTGGYTPGFDAASRAIRRDASRQIADTSLNAETDIQDRVIANRMAAATGASNAENSYQTLRTGNMFRGMSGAASAYGNAGNMYSQAGSQEQGLESYLNDLEFKNNDQRADFESRAKSYQLAGLNGEAAMTQAMMDQKNADSGFNANMKLAGIGGLENIYGSDVNQLNAGYDRSTGLLNSGTQADIGYYGPRNDLATRPGIGGNIMNAVGAGAGLASNFFTPRIPQVSFNQMNAGGR